MTAPLENPAVALRLLTASRALGAAIGFVVAWFAYVLWTHSGDPVCQKLGGIGFGGIRGVGAVHPLHFLISFSDTVKNFLTGVMAGCERAMVNSFGALLWAFYDTVFTIVKAVYDANTAIDNVWARVTRDAVPAKTTTSNAQLKSLKAELARDEVRLGRLEHALSHPAHGHAGAIGAATEADFAQLRRGIDRLQREIAHIERQIKVLSRTKATTHAKTHTDVYGLPHWVARRIGRLEKKVVGAGAVALVAGVALRMGFRWWKCSAFNRVGKRLTCGSWQFLESLLSLALDALIVTNLCTVTATLTRVAKLFEPVLVKFTVGMTDLFHCQGASRPADFYLNRAALPDLKKSVITL